MPGAKRRFAAAKAAVNEGEGFSQFTIQIQVVTGYRVQVTGVFEYKTGAKQDSLLL